MCPGADTYISFARMGREGRQLTQVTWLACWPFSPRRKASEDSTTPWGSKLHLSPGLNVSWVGLPSRVKLWCPP